jgi:transaldolase
LEVWWDSSPLVYPNWANKLLAGVDEAARPALAAHLKRWFDPQHPERTLFRGVTTNPPLSLQAMQNDPPRWQAWIEDYCRQYPEADTGQVYWALYKEIVRLGAEAFRPLFERTGYLYGYISAQVDPRRFFEPELMLAQALDLAPLAPNVMIKIPGTREGIGVIKGLTARGIPTNLTSGYTVPQFVAVAEAVQAGLLEARSRGVDLSRWRSVVTFMSVRWESAPEFEAQAQELGIPLSPDDRRLAGVAIFKQAYRVFSQRAYPSKMLICSVRMGPTVDGVLRCWHLEETAGASAVFTLPPVFLAEMFTTGAHLNYEPRIREDIPAGVLERLLKIPYFRKAYEPDGYTPDEFNSLPSLLSTYKEFSGATEKMVQFVAERLPSRQTISAAA